MEVLPKVCGDSPFTENCRRSTELKAGHWVCTFEDSEQSGFNFSAEVFANFPVEKTPT